MRIQMCKSDFGCVDGFGIIRLEKGQVYELPRKLAAKLVNKGSAVLVSVNMVNKNEL
jgi:hypothetical protein